MSELAGNKLIAKNTVVVYSQLFVSLLIGLLSSRFVLKQLGAEDYGLYSVVGGIISLFTFLSSSLSTTTTRFLNYEMGKEKGDLNLIFNIFLLIHIFFGVLIFISAEVLGLVYILHYLNIPEFKQGDAIFVFQVSTITASLGIIIIPFRSLFIAYEKFTAIAAIDIGISIVKFIFILCLFLIKGNHLRFYAISMAFASTLPMLYYYIRCKSNWPIVIKRRIVRNRQLYKAPLTFNNYNILGSITFILRGQGSNMLINYFFGTITNAAYAIANSVFYIVNSIAGGIDSAASPQITQSVGQSQIDYATNLASRICRLCILLLLIIYFPLNSELVFLINLWLGNNIPDGTIRFCQYILIFAVVSSTSGGLTKLIDALGNIKWYKIQVSILYVGSIFVGFYLFSTGHQASSIFLVFIYTDIISRCVQLFLLGNLSKIDIYFFIKNSYLRPFLCFVILYLYTRIYNIVPKEEWYESVEGLIVTILMSITVCYYCGLKRRERKKVNAYVYHRAKRLLMK